MTTDDKLIRVKESDKESKLPQTPKDEVAKLNAETELIQAQIKNEETKRLRDLPAVLNAREGTVEARERELDEREAELAQREEEVAQRELQFATGLKRFTEQKGQAENGIREQQEELVTMITHEQGQRDEVEVALAYITDVSPILVNPDVRREIIKRLEKCLERWAITPRYDNRGKYIRSIYRT